MTHLRAIPIDYMSVLPTSFIAPYLPNNTNEHVLFPTLTLLFLAIFGIALSLKKNKYMVGLSVALMVMSVTLSFGDQQGFSLGSYSTGTLRLPYYYLYTYLPIFQIIRVPARFAIFVILSLSMLSAFGIKELIKRKYGTWIIGAFFCIFLLEIWQIRTPFVSIPLKNSIPDVYVWIAKQPEPMILAELPVSLFYHGRKMEEQLTIPYTKLEKEDVYALETYRVYFSSFHQKRMLNGYSGYLSDTYNKLTEMLEGFPSEYTILEMRKIGITHIVVHSLQYDPKIREEMMATLKLSPLVTLTFDNSIDFVYRIAKSK